MRGSWLPTRVAPCPANHTLTWLLKMLHMMREPLGANQRKRADIGIWQYAAEPSRRGEQGPALGNDIIDQHNALRGRHRRRCYK